MTHEQGKALEHQAPETTVRQDSDRLLEELSALKQLESEKQRTAPTSPEFDALADRVTRQARKVLEAAQDEQDHGEELTQRDRQGTSTRAPRGSKGP